MPDYQGLPLLEFANKQQLREWLLANHQTSPDVWVRVYKAKSGVRSVSFEELLDQGLCFGWSESLRHGYDAQSYLQKFTPRKTKGTTSARNLAHARKLIEAGEMTAAGLKALGMD